jgi:hypothetical protein
VNDTSIVANRARHSSSTATDQLPAGSHFTHPQTAVRGAPPLCEEVVRPQRTKKGKENPHSCHSQYIAHRGACGQTRVVPHDCQPKPKPTEMGGTKCLARTIEVLDPARDRRSLPRAGPSDAGREVRPRPELSKEVNV